MNKAKNHHVNVQYVPRFKFVYFRPDINILNTHNEFLFKTFYKCEDSKTGRFFIAFNGKVNII